MPHKFRVEDLHRLESAERHRSMPPKRTLRALGLKRGMVFADVGAGTGFFALPAAQLVGQAGRVYALDVQEPMLDALRAKKPPPWLEVLACSESSLPLPAAAADMVFCCFVLHETEDPAALLREMGRVAKPHAPVVALEWAKIHHPEGPPFEERIHHHRAEELFLKAGLCFKRLEFFNPSQYAVAGFRKP